MSISFLLTSLIVCLSPGTVSIKTSPPDVQHHPSGQMPDLTVKDFALALGLAT